MKLHIAIEDVQDAEADVGKQLRALGERHAAEHDLYHLGHTLAKQCEQHAQQLRPFAERYAAPREHEPHDGHAWSDTLERIRHKLSELIARQPTGILLLNDLRHVFLTAQDAGVLWVMVAQAAQAIRDPELLQLCTACHTDTQAQMHWLLTRIKTAAPQALTV